MRNRFHLLGCKCSVWERDVVYRPARTPGCPVLRVCCLPPVWSRVPRFFAGSDPQGHAATMLLESLLAWECRSKWVVNFIYLELGAREG